MAGPWGYDLLSVPARFECQPPTIRLEGDFCGWPVNGVWLFADLGNIVNSLVHHEHPGVVGAGEIGLLLLWFVITLLIIAPVISLLLRLKSRRAGWPRLHISLFILLAVLEAFYLLLPRQYSLILIWGQWLYSGTIFLLLVEMLLAELGNKRKLSVESR